MNQSTHAQDADASRSKAPASQRRSGAANMPALYPTSADAIRAVGTLKVRNTMFLKACASVRRMENILMSFTT